MFGRSVYLIENNNPIVFGQFKFIWVNKGDSAWKLKLKVPLR